MSLKASQHMLLTRQELEDEQAKGRHMLHSTFQHTADAKIFAAEPPTGKELEDEEAEERGQVDGAQQRRHQA